MPASGIDAPNAVRAFRFPCTVPKRQMNRRDLLRSSVAAVAAAFGVAAHGGLLQGHSDPDEALQAGEAQPESAAPASPPVAVGPITFRREFTDASRPLLQHDGGPFNPYFVYFGGDGTVQPEGEAGFRWWNDELQVYTTERYTPAPYNPNSIGDGVLSMTAIPAAPDYPHSPKLYLGSCLETSKGPHWNRRATRAARLGFEQKYGYWECRAKVPRAQGLWSAFWLNGGVIPGKAGHGEIDIFEMVSASGRIHQSAHDWFGPHAQETVPLKVGFDHGAAFHRYGLHWTPSRIAWYVDGEETSEASSALVAKYRDQCGPMFLSMNLAVGGAWAGPPDASTVFPAVLQFDYVRAYAIA
jgi:hypothetical protein